MKETNYAFKILYVFGIIFVVAGHCGYGGISLGYDWFMPNVFHLGLFMFISGYFYDSAHENNVWHFICYKFKKLMVPLYLWNLVYGLLVLASKQIGFTIGEHFSLWNLLVAPLVDGHQFMYNLAGWYVPSLFFAHVVNVCFRKILKKLSFCKNWVVEGVYLGIGIAGVYLSMQGYNTGIWLPFLRLAYFLPFYGLGTLYKNELEHKVPVSRLAYFGIIFLVQLLLITVNKGVIAFYPSWCTGFNHVFTPFLLGGLGIFFWLGVAKILEPAIGRSKYILLVAEHGYTIMINQFLGFFVVKTFFALINKCFHMCGSFSWEGYYTDIWYYYLPGGLSQWYILYLLAGILVPVLLGIMIKKGCSLKK